MPRIYKPKPGTKIRKKYDEHIIQQALEELKSSPISLVAKKFDISKSVLGRHKLRVMKTSGGQTTLTAETEDYIVQHLNIFAEWGYPLTTMDLRHVIKMILDTHKIKQDRFKNNFPGPDFVEGFLKRQKDKISKRIYQNIKRARAAVSTENIRQSIEKDPLDLNEVLSRLPNETDIQVEKDLIDESSITHLKELRYGIMDIKEAKFGKKIVAGWSLSQEEEEEEKNEPEKIKAKLKTVKQDNLKQKGKCKVVGKETKHTAAEQMCDTNINIMETISDKPKPSKTKKITNIKLNSKGKKNIF